MSENTIEILSWMDSASTKTGFGVVSKNILSYLCNTGRYNIHQLAINYPPRFKNIDSIPWTQMSSKLLDPNEPYGKALFLRSIAENDYDIVWIMNDTYVVYDVVKDLDAIIKNKKSRGKKIPKIVYYYPVDCHVPEKASSMIKFADVPVCYNDYGRAETLKTIPEIESKLQQIPHGIDLSVFKPFSWETQQQLKSKFLGAQADKFLFLNVNRNSHRKQLARCIYAFSEFKKQVPRSILLLHTQAVDGTNSGPVIDLRVVVNDLGLSFEEDVLFPKIYEPSIAFPDETMNELYNAADCFITTHCFTGDTLVNTLTGYKKISDIDVGDNVLTHNGIYKSVHQVFKNKSPGFIYKIRLRNLGIPIRSTGNHPFLTIDKKEYKKLKYENKIPTPKWVNCEDLKSEDVLIYPIPSYCNVQDNSYVDMSCYVKNDYWEIDNNKITPNRTQDRDSKSINRFIDFADPDMARLLGYYISEGSLNKGNIQFSLNKEEDYIIDDIRNIINKHITTTYRELSVSESKKDKSVNVIFCCRLLGEVFKEFCGKDVYNKSIPQFLLKAEPAVKKELLRGLFRGDGTISNRCISYKTVSLDLILKIRDILFNLGVICSLYKDDNSKGYGNGYIYVIKIYNPLQIYSSNLFDNEGLLELRRKQNNQYIYLKDEFAYIPITSIESEIYEDYVYNLGVEDDNSYVAGSCSVHNCGEGWGLSVSESMAAGTPVIAPSNTAMPQILGENSERGYLYPMKDYLFIDNSGLRPFGYTEDVVLEMFKVFRAGRKDKNPKVLLAREWAEKHSWIDICQQWDSLFQQVLQQPEDDILKVDDIEVERL